MIIQAVAIKPIARATSGFFETMHLIQFNEFNQTLLIANVGRKL